MGLLAEFRKFALRGNLIDLTVGFTVGAAFTTIAKSLVTDIIMPPVGLLLGGSDFSDLFLVLANGAKAGPPYHTLASAQAAGAVTMNYGVFLNNLIAFLMVTAVMFLLVRAMNRIEGTLEAKFGDAPAEDEPSEKKCEFCRTTIPYRATRCPNCTSELTPIHSLAAAPTEA
jgi:large conductance mechanosensitive channel